MRGLWKSTLLVIISAAVFSVLVIGCGRDTVAKINGTKITKEEYYKRLERAPIPGLQMEPGAYVLQQMISEQLILGLAKEKGVAPTDAQIKERIADLKKRQPNLDKQMKDSGITEDLLHQMMEVQQAFFNLRTRGVKVSDEEIKKYYDENKKSRYTEPEQAEVALILTGNKADADAAIQMLDKGIQFSTVAQAKSIHEPSKQNGGRFPMPIKRSPQGGPGPEMQNAIFSAQEGKYTKPVPADNGTYAIFQVIKKTPEVTKTYEDVKKEIEQILLLQKGDQKNNVQEEIAKFRDSAKIDIGIDRYEDVLKPSGAPAHGGPAPAGAPTGVPAGGHSEGDGHNH